jgi:chaperone required for assembly of F1-ATPase
VRRFYKEAAAVGGEVRLDDRPVRTPARNALVVPSERLAAAIAEEWAAQGERIDPRAMPLTGLANAAIDRVAPGKEAFARGLAAYAESDLLCYRADAPRPLVDRQKALWDPILLWARRRFDVDFTVAEGVIHRPQPRATVERLAHAVHTRSPWELAAFSPLVTISGSLVMTLALAEQALSLEEAWAAAVLDERWQAEQWGEDAEAARALAARRSEFDAACLFLSLL